MNFLACRYRRRPAPFGSGFVSIIETDNIQPHHPTADHFVIMQIFGIDVGPKKGGHIFDGTKDRVDHLPPSKLEKQLEDWAKCSDVLIAWDAPLTGPTTVNGPLVEFDLTKRQIERFFSPRTPKGISVNSYSSCSHWTISRRLLGLPRMGRFDSETIPFRLLTDEKMKPAEGKNIVEVHPGVALWQWLHNDRELIASGFKYKGKDFGSSSAHIKLKLASFLPIKAQAALRAAVDDDELDAIIAWSLAELWINPTEVSRSMLLGNHASGSFLLPEDGKLLAEFEEYVAVPIN